MELEKSLSKSLSPGYIKHLFTQQEIRLEKPSESSLSWRITRLFCSVLFGVLRHINSVEIIGHHHRIEHGRERQIQNKQRCDHPLSPTWTWSFAAEYPSRIFYVPLNTGIDRPVLIGSFSPGAYARTTQHDKADENNRYPSSNRWLHRVFPGNQPFYDIDRARRHSQYGKTRRRMFTRPHRHAGT